MAAGYYPMPGYNVGPGINFEPINRALENYQNVRFRNEEIDQQRQNQNALMARYGSADARADKQLTMQQEEFAFRKAGQPLENQYRQAQIDLATAQAKAAGQKNVLDEAVAGMLTEAPPPHSTPGSSRIQGGPGGFQPQSFSPEAQLGRKNALMPDAGPQPQLTPARNFLMPPPYDVNGGARLQLAADVGAQGAPDAVDSVGPQSTGPGAVYGLPGEASVDTPLGRMPRDRARRLGMGLAIGGKGDAGKMMIDAASGGANLQKPTQNAIEERILNSATQLGRLADIEKRFDPAFLEIPNRLKLTGAAWSAKFGGKLGPQQQQELGRFAKFRSASVNNLNTILKELSGAAVTPQEYERIQNDAPVAGTGIFDGDDPVSFKAKLDRTKDTLRSAIARMTYMRSQGLNFAKEDLDMFMGLDDVPARYEARANEIETKIRQGNPSITPQALEEQTAVQLKREWGI